MKKLVMVIGLCLCMVSSAFATSSEIITDEFGNPIEWVDDGVTGEDAAGEELNYIPPNADLLEAERLEQSENEAESIAEIISQNKVSEADVEKATISARFEVPENWRGSNIQVSLYNKDLWKGYTVYIYKQNGFESVEELPMGTYEIRGAMVVGDTNNIFPLLVDANGRSEFELGTSNEAIVINVVLAGRNDYVSSESQSSDVQKSESDVYTDGSEENVEQKMPSGVMRFLKDNAIFGIILACGIVAVVIKSKRDEEY